MKRCSRCREEKPLAEFYENKRTRDGVTSACRECMKAYQRDRRLAQPDSRPGGAGRLAGEPFTLEHFESWAQFVILDDGSAWELEDFQRSFLEDVFSGVPESWLIVPEGNGKTTTIAGLALYHCQFREYADVPTAASSREQAELLFRQAEGMVKRSPMLTKRFRCQAGHRRILFSAEGFPGAASQSATSRIQVFAADDRTGDGIIPTLCVVDELHRHRNLGLYRTWSGKLDKRGGQIITISTAGEPGGEFEVTRDRIRDDGESERTGCFTRVVAPGLVMHEWALPETGAIDDFDLVKAANPFTGITPETLREKWNRPSMTVEHWRRFVCNLPTRSGLAAINEPEWDAAETDDEIPAGESVVVGLDVGWKWDTTAIVPCWVRDEEFRLLGPATVLVPPRDGTSLDPAKVERAFTDLHDRNPVETVVMDMSRAEQLAAWLESELGAHVIDRGTGNSAAVEDYEGFMEALRSGWLRHTGDRELRRHALNAIARVLPFGDARFDRPSQGRVSGDQDRRVIDALVAAGFAHTIAAQLVGSGSYVA